MYGAMLAGIDYVLMGAGTLFRVSGVLDRLARHDTRRRWPAALRPLKRPAFLAIASSHVLAAASRKRATRAIDGFAACVGAERLFGR
jgi:hypothetical protein